MSKNLGIIGRVRESCMKGTLKWSAVDICEMGKNLDIFNSFYRWLKNVIARP